MWSHSLSMRFVILSISAIYALLWDGYAESAIDWDRAREFWAFKTPEKVPPPTISDRDWAETDIDYFVLARLEANGLAAAPAADRPTIIRRLSYDLTGLPPTTELVEQFISDPAPDAYGKLVDRLIDSEAFGERFASLWLNVSRFAVDQAHKVGNNKKFFYPHAHRYRPVGHRCVQRGPPLRRVYPPAAGRRFVRRRSSGSVRVSRARPTVLQPQAARRHGRRMGRSGRYRHPRVSRFDRRLRTLSRSQIRRDRHGGLLCPRGRVCQHRHCRPAKSGRLNFTQSRMARSRTSRSSTAVTSRTRARKCRGDLCGSSLAGSRSCSPTGAAAGSWLRRSPQVAIR